MSDEVFWMLIGAIITCALWLIEYTYCRKLSKLKKDSISNMSEFQKRYFPEEVGKKCPSCGEKIWDIPRRINKDGIL